MLLSAGTPLLKHIRRFRTGEAGVAAVEFAILLPLLLLLYVYLVDFSRAFDEKRKVDQLASTVTDLIAEQSTAQSLSSQTVSSILGASASLVAPFGSDGLTVTVSVIDLASKADGTCCDATVKWSFTQGGTLRPCDVDLQQVAASVPPQPKNILASTVDTTSGSAAGRGELVIADVADGFQPIFNNLMPFFRNGFERTAYAPPRMTGQLVLQSPTSSQQGQQAQVCS